MREIKAVIFDMDGVLIDSEPSWGEAMLAVMKEVKIPYTVDDVANYQGVRVGDIVSAVWDAHPSKEYSKQLIEDMICQRVSELVLDHGRVMDGISNILDFVKKGKLPLGVATSTPRSVAVNFLKRVGITDDIDVLCTGDEVIFGKPHPEIYLLCANRLGVKPEQCLVFEDSVNGVVAAKAARTFCVAVPVPELYDDVRYGVADVKLRGLQYFNDNVLK
ncbi:MAG: hexitol phosphatase HxpB [Flavobacteriales bacterium]|nr:hexitol phosphatase HxpB [Flavobacteriales bacterium]